MDGRHAQNGSKNQTSPKISAGRAKKEKPSISPRRKQTPQKTANKSLKTQTTDKTTQAKRKNTAQNRLTVCRKRTKRYKHGKTGGGDDWRRVSSSTT